MSGNAIRMVCPNLGCRKILAVPQEFRGKTIRCGSCGTTIKVPSSPAAPQPVQPTAEPDKK